MFNGLSFPLKPVAQIQEHAEYTVRVGQSTYIDPKEKGRPRQSH